MQPHEFRRELERRGLLVLGIGQHRGKPEALVVYLHGSAGQWVDGWARRLIFTIPGVLAVADSVQTPTIILVRVELAATGGAT